MNKTTRDRETEQRKKWAMMTADVIAKWHSNTDLRSTMQGRPEIPTEGLYTLHKWPNERGSPETFEHCHCAHRSSLHRASNGVVNDSERSVAASRSTCRLSCLLQIW